MRNVVSMSVVLLGLMVLPMTANAGLIELSEDFSGRQFNESGFLMNGGFTFATRSANDFGLRIFGRDQYSTVDEFNASRENPVTFGFTMNFLYNDIAFVAMRSASEHTDSNSEPLNSVFLRIHNFQGGHTGVGHNNSENYEYKNPSSGDMFYRQAVQTEIIDFGDSINVVMKNLVTNQINAFSYLTSFSAGGLYQLSASGGVVFDNVYLSQNIAPLSSTEPVASVSEPAGAALFSLGLGALGFAMRRRKKSV